jgi:hypothetical protein
VGHRLGPPHLFSTLDSEQHRLLRKALSNAPWTIGQLKKTWESRFDNQVGLFIEKMREHANAKRTLVLSDKVAEFAVRSPRQYFLASYLILHLFL